MTEFRPSWAPGARRKDKLHMRSATHHQLAVCGATLVDIGLPEGASIPRCRSCVKTLTLVLLRLSALPRSIAKLEVAAQRKAEVAVVQPPAAQPEAPMLPFQDCILTPPGEPVPAPSDTNPSPAYTVTDIPPAKTSDAPAVRGDLMGLGEIEF